jgi:hypothetical protein
MSLSFTNFLLLGNRAPGFSNFDANNRQYDAIVENDGVEANTDDSASTSMKLLSDRVTSVEGTNYWIVDKIFRVHPSSKNEELALDFWKKTHNRNFQLVMSTGALTLLSNVMSFMHGSFGQIVISTGITIGGCMALGAIIHQRDVCAIQIKLWSESIGKRFARDRTAALYKTFPDIYQNRSTNLLTKQELIKKYEELFFSFTRTFLDKEDKTDGAWLNVFFKHEVHPFDVQIMIFAYAAAIPEKKRVISQTYSILKANFEEKKDISLSIQQLNSELYLVLTEDIL